MLEIEPKSGVCKAKMIVPVVHTLQPLQFWFKKLFLWNRREHRDIHGGKLSGGVIGIRTLYTLNSSMNNYANHGTII